LQAVHRGLKLPRPRRARRGVGGVAGALRLQGVHVRLGTFQRPAHLVQLAFTFPGPRRGGVCRVSDGRGHRRRNGFTHLVS